MVIYIGSSSRSLTLYGCFKCMCQVKLLFVYCATCQSLSAPYKTMCIQVWRAYLAGVELCVQHRDDAGGTAKEEQAAVWHGGATRHLW